jgi:hypothetical protein
MWSKRGGDVHLRECGRRNQDQLGSAHVGPMSSEAGAMRIHADP